MYLENCFDVSPLYMLLRPYLCRPVVQN
uniref:Uncharacterized protein n=1 Tax=Zea mays TaxID=4577 RepID=C4J8H6_MAIZE|nr:unknown [Zea mays]